MPDKKLNLRVHIKNVIKCSHEQNKRNLQIYFNFLTSARAFKC